jgi:hypothetical protein
MMNNGQKIVPSLYLESLRLADGDAGLSSLSRQLGRLRAAHTNR